MHNTHEYRKPIQTLGDLYVFVSKADLPATKKGPICSAIKRADQMVGNGVLDLPANAAAIMKALNNWSPAMAGISMGAFANLKSRLRAAFRLAKPRIRNPRSRFALTGDWAALQATLDVSAQRKLSRLFHFAATRGFNPGDLRDDLLGRFASHLRDEAMVGDWEGVLRSTIAAWNKLPQVTSDKGLQRLTPPQPKRTPYLRYRLIGPSAALLEDYLANWRGKFSAEPNAWLFPDSKGSMMDPKHLGEMIHKHSKLILGVAITPHQFRHISAESFLLENPDKVQMMSEHLGHRDTNTTRTYYTRSKQKQASRAYQEHVLKARGEAHRRLRRKKGPAPRPKWEDRL